MTESEEHKKVIRCVSNINIKLNEPRSESPTPKTPTGQAPPLFKEKSSNSSSQNSVAKILLLGSAKVGKTSIIQRFLHDKFEARYVPTVEDVHNQKFVAKNKLIPVEIIDTCGSFHFPAMIRLCITKATAFILVFSNDDLESFNKTKELLQEIKAVRLDNESDVLLPPIVIVCNKSDLSTSNQIDEKKIMEWLVKSSLKPSQFVYSSAKNNESILSIFESLYNQNDLINLVEFENFQEKGILSTSGTHLDQHKSMLTNKNEDNVEPAKPVNRFRASFRLSRKTSQKKDKNKPEYTHLNCNVS